MPPRLFIIYSAAFLHLHEIPSLLIICNKMRNWWRHAETLTRRNNQKRVFQKAYRRDNTAEVASLLMDCDSIFSKAQCSAIFIQPTSSVFGTDTFVIYFVKGGDI